MKIVGALRIASLLLLPGAMASTYAQEREQEKQPEQKQQPAKPAQQPAKRAPQQHAQEPAKQAPQKQAAQQPAKQAPQQHAQQPAKQAPQKQAAQQPAKPAEQKERAQQQVRPAQGQQQQANRTQPAAHGRIPDDRFRASFGREHTFHVNRADFAGGTRRFQYGGFWFAAANPWPGDWLYTDSVYVDYMNGGYFLCDPVHPGVYLSITIG
jgi:outer membrane biosynthesis protein TonB